jgi:hypothetical protein
VIGGKGLEKTGNMAFLGCISLHEITNLPAIRAIKNHTFNRCLKLKTVILGEGLEEIGEEAFQY